jgi:hypothetical protein
MRFIRRLPKFFALIFLAPLALHAAWWLAHSPDVDWHSADWSSAGLLPSASASPEASVHVYAAPTGRWKGVFAVHSWIVVKEQGARRYTRFDVVGWGRPVRSDNWAPDARWFGNNPQLVAVIKGAEAVRVIPTIRASVARYPHGKTGDYRIWPGPNSNTFVAEILAQIPEAGVVLPANAIGKDFRGSGFYAGLSPSGTGVQVSVLGLFGLTVGWVDGVEVNVLSLVTGLDWRHGALKLPGWGTVRPLGAWRSVRAFAG